MSVHNLSVILTGNSTSLRSSLLAAGRDVEKFEKQVQSSGSSAGKAGSLLSSGLKVGVLAVGAAMAYSIGQAVAFDTELRNLQSITKQTDSEIAAVGDTLVGLSTQLPQSAKTLAAGLYDIASSGFAGAEGLEVLEASAVAASAGLTTTEVSAKAITSVLNAYGREAKDATDVSDVLFQAVNVGVVTFEELSGTIGDVVGTAAAATVEIDEVASAIATMTLSGISAAEAGTSLNRLIQSLIDPSETLSKVLHDLGYESGAAALEQDSLSTVMLKLMDASKGSIETLLQWFPEIRAARGALALMSAEGRNYLAVVAAIEVKEKRAGAARAALNEQLKAVSAQWQLFINRVNAAAITVGTALLPVVLQVLEALSNLGRYGIQIVQEALQRLGPFFTAVWQVAQDLAEVFQQLVEFAGPVAGAFAALAGIGVVTALNAIAEALSAVTGFLADHPGLIKAVAVVLAGIYLPAVLTATGATVANTAAMVKNRAVWASMAAGNLLSNIAGRLSLLASGLREIVGLGGKVSYGVTDIKNAFAGLGASLAVGGAFLAVTMAVQKFTSEMDKAKEHGKSWAQEFTGSFDSGRATMAQLEGEIGRITTASGQMQEAADNAINPFLDKRLKTARDELDATNAPLIELRDNAKMLEDELDLTAEEALNLARDENFMAGAMDAATGEFDKQAAAALAELDALRELSDQISAMYDPLFGLQDATQGLHDAQMAAAIAAKEHGAGSVEAAEANQAAVRAAVEYQSSLINLKSARRRRSRRSVRSVGWVLQPTRPTVRTSSSRRTPTP
jgi:TP901 family phage tail tape measure protein